MSVDFTLPEAPVSPTSTELPVPLTILKKRYLRNFDVTDPSGGSLSVLTTKQNADVVADGFRFFLGDAWRAEDEELSRVLHGIVGEHDPAIAKNRLAAALGRRGELGLALERIQSDSIAEVLRFLLSELAAGYILFVPLELDAGERRLLKFSYDAPLRKTPETPGGHVYRLVTDLSASFGWSGWLEDFEEIQVGWAESYHLEIGAPADTWVGEAVLETEEGLEVDRESSPHLLRPHLHATDRPRDQAAQLTMLIYPRGDSLVVPLFLAAAVIAGVLSYVPEYGGELDGQTLGALLLVPFGLSALYVRPEEHSYVTRGLRALRMVALVPVAAGVLVLALIGLGLLGGKEVDPTALDAAQWAARVSVGAAYILLVAALVPGIASHTRPMRRRLQGAVGEWPRTLRLATFAVVLLLWPAAIGIVGYLLYSLLPV